MAKQHKPRLVSLALFVVLLSFLLEEGGCYEQYSFLPSSGATGSSSPDNFARLKGRLFFRANDGITGRELWSTDGSKAGTKLFADLYFGSSGFIPDGLTVVKNRLFFKPNYVSDASLWVSDGTKKGTRRLLAPGTQSVHLPFVPLGNRLIYTRTADSGAGIELWALNVGSLTAKLLASNWTSGADFRTSNGTHAVWFVPDETGSGRVWITDGRPKGTRRVLGIPGSNTTFPIMNVLARGRTFIVTRSGNGVGDTEFYSTNGITGSLVFTLPNVTLSRDGPLGSFLASKRLVFGGTSSEEGWGIYVTNLSSTATRIFDTPQNSVVEFVTSSRVNGRAVFTADKLYSTDGTTSGTRALTSNAVLHPEVIGSISGRLIFLSTDFTTAALYRTDGTAAGTRRLWTGESFTYSGNGAFGKRIFFGCSSPTNQLGEELCVTDGTVRGTGVFKDLNRIDIAPLYGIAPATIDQRTVAFIYNSSIWTANGNPRGTRRVPNPQPVSSFVAGVGSLSGWIFYVDSEGFWKYQGSSRNITRISDNIGIPFAATTTHVFLRSLISRESFALYSYDGTGDPLSLGILTADPTFAVFKNYLFLAGSRNGSGTELVVSDGLNLTLLKDLNPGGNSSNPRSFALAPELDALLFIADSPTPSLWKTDGTENGTVLLHELPATSVLSRIVPGIAEVADRGVFILMPVERQDNGLFTYGLFLFDTESGEMSNSLRQFRSVEGFEVASTGDRFVFILYFRTVEDTESSQLWSSDGTRAGTFRERAPATNFFRTSLLTAPDRRAFFVASSPAEGEELWYIRSSSLRLAPGPSIPGPFGSNPRDLVVIGNRLYFTALTPRGVAQVFTLQLRRP